MSSNIVKVVIFRVVGLSPGVELRSGSRLGLEIPDCGSAE